MPMMAQSSRFTTPVPVMIFKKMQFKIFFMVWFLFEMFCDAGMVNQFISYFKPGLCFESIVSRLFVLPRCVVFMYAENLGKMQTKKYLITVRKWISNADLCFVVCNQCQPIT